MSVISNTLQVPDEAKYEGVWAAEQMVLELLFAEGVRIDRADVEFVLSHQATRNVSTAHALIRIS